MDENFSISRRALLYSGALAAITPASSAAGQQAVETGAAAIFAKSRSQREYVIRGGYLLTFDPKLGDIAKGDLHIRDGRIVSVTQNMGAVNNAEIIDANGQIVMPGFVEVHWHMWNSLFRGMARDATDYFALSRLSEFYTPEDHYIAVRYAATEAINAGVTTCHDWANATRDFKDAEAEMRALLDSGIRARFGYGDFTPVSDPATSPLSYDQLAKAQAWAEQIGQRRITVGLVVQNSSNMSAEVTAARRLGLKTIGPHVSLADHLELLGPDIIFTHGTNTPRSMLDLIAAKGVKVGLCPLTDPLIGAGFPPLHEFLEAGVPLDNIGFSVDVNCQTCVDPFASMRMLMDSARVAARRGVSQSSIDAIVASDNRKHGLAMPRDVLQIATINGARVLGLDEQVGSLTPGKRADIIIVRTDDINMLPAQNTNATYQLVQNAQPTNVDTVIIDGCVLKRHGRLIGVDSKQISNAAAAAQAAIRRRANLPNLDLSL